jgi:hypothetical protein
MPTIGRPGGAGKVPGKAPIAQKSRLRIKILGLLGAEASGSVAIAALVLIVLMVLASGWLR